METIKISETEIEVSKVVPATTITTKYERGFIEEQIRTIARDMDNYVALRDAEIKECMDILVAMDEMNIISKVDIIEEALPVEEIIN